MTVYRSTDVALGTRRAVLLADRQAHAEAWAALGAVWARRVAAVAGACVVLLGFIPTAALVAPALLALAAVAMTVRLAVEAALRWRWWRAWRASVASTEDVARDVLRLEALESLADARKRVGALEIYRLLLPVVACGAVVPTALLSLDVISNDGSFLRTGLPVMVGLLVPLAYVSFLAHTPTPPRTASWDQPLMALGALGALVVVVLTTWIGLPHLLPALLWARATVRSERAALEISE